MLFATYGMASSPTNTQCKILDASVLIKCFVEEDGSQKALALLEEVLREPSEFIVPELLFFELANILNRLIPPEDPRNHLFEVLINSPLQRASFTVELSNGIRKFQNMGLSGYDGAYVALAELVGGIWITADAKAHKTIAHLRLSRLL